ncbi:homoserine kinase [Flavilitoribacter nigricans]|uniref:Homoserine kinase n=1 Tax=Flavilitoribacter nigricans (strain ATCC 23147 / DSM 23189 / NBRC 102662 / NCIMB 1420 / SS-2) TaxID=1122177 RepID=A0A2D0N5M1_FLAN2|nr:homoserine kinase [Flavilitoribacter nigricans]PHN03686.1 homoserine kinase [Flavilitoribacter nigricans DSM 23189 = NBRC 102662]
MNNSVRVFAPASVANVAVGFDILGFALDSPGDEITVSFSDRESGGLKITAIHGADNKLPLVVEKNTAGFAAQQLLRHLGKEDLAIDMEIHKKMPFGSGLGSSAASAAAGVMAVNALLDHPLSKEEILHFAVLGEQIADGAYHADNVAPSLLGGMILIRNNEDLDVHQLPIPDDLYAAVVHPEVEVLTKDARDVLSDKICLKQSIEQGGNLAAFILGLMKADYDLLSRSLKDVIIEPQRAKLIPQFYEVKNAAISASALGCSISGAGPSIFALCKGLETAQKVGAAMEKAFTQAQIENQLYISKINQHGAVVIE